MIKTRPPTQAEIDERLAAIAKIEREPALIRESDRLRAVEYRAKKKGRREEAKRAESHRLSVAAELERLRDINLARRLDYERAREAAFIAEHAPIRRTVQRPIGETTREEYLAACEWPLKAEGGSW